MRRGFVFLHRYIGLALAGFLVIAGLTGSVLAFQSELDAWLNPRLFHAEGTGPALSPSRLVAAIEHREPGVTIFSLVLPAGIRDSASAYVGPKDETHDLGYDQLFVDPTSGTILGGRLNGAFRFDRAHLIPFIYRLHHTLTIPGKWGAWLMGGVALVWMLDCFAGFCLTLPRGRPFWKKWKMSWRIKHGAGGYRFNLDLHRAFGLWFWTVLFSLALSGVALNLNSEVFRPVLSAFLPTSPSLWERSPLVKRPAMMLDWDAALAKSRAEAARRGWDRPVRLIYADRAKCFYLVRFGRLHDPGFGASSILVSCADGRILSVEEAGGGKAGDVVAGLMFPIHSGQIAGLAGRILICITGVAVTMLSATGVYIWWKKQAARTSGRRYGGKAFAALRGRKAHAAE